MGLYVGAYCRAIESLVLWSPDPLVGQMGGPPYLCARACFAWKEGYTGGCPHEEPLMFPLDPFYSCCK